MRLPPIYPRMITHFVHLPRNSVKPWPECGERFLAGSGTLALFDQQEGDNGKQDSSSSLRRARFGTEAAGLITSTISQVCD